MKKLQASIILFLITLLITTTGYCEDNKVRLYFGNGMLCDAEGAEGDLSVLRALLKNKIQGTDIESKMAYDISHNPTEGGLDDFFESALQTIDTNISQFWRFLSGLDGMPDYLQEEYKWISAQIDQAMVAGYPSIPEHVEEYNKRLCEGDKVLVMAHSQGNLYANIAYTGINENVIDGFGIVSVANPDSYVAGDGPYTTIMEDQVIAIIPLALIRNLDNNNYPNIFDWSGHKFVESYLASGHPAETKILDDIETTIDKLQWPEGSCGVVYALVSISNNMDETFCFIWDVGKNQYAEILDNDDNQVNYPTSKDKISYWINSSQNIGRDVYSYLSGVGDKTILNPRCSIDGMEGECTDTITSRAKYPDVDGLTTLVNDGVVNKTIAENGARFERTTDVTMKAYYNSVFLSFMNNTPGTTTCRIEGVFHTFEIEYNYEDIYHYKAGGLGDTFEMITPLGSLATWQIEKGWNEVNYNWPEYDNFSGEVYTEQLVGMQATREGKYSDKTLVQLFTIELQKRNTYRPCGRFRNINLWIGVGLPDGQSWDEPCPIESDTITPLKDFKVIASADIVEDGVNQDPRLLSRNIQFEAGIQQLYDHFKGSLSEPIPEYSFSLELLQANRP